MEQKGKNSKINQLRITICPLLNFKSKENILKNCRKLNEINKFVDKNFFQVTLEHREQGNSGIS